MVPSIAVMPREGSFALAFFGRMRKVQEPSFPLSSGRKSFALKRIDAAFVIWLGSKSNYCRSKSYLAPHALENPKIVPEQTQPRPKHVAAIETAHARVRAIACWRLGKLIQKSASQVSQRVTAKSIAA